MAGLKKNRKKVFAVRTEWYDLCTKLSTDI